MMKGIENQSQRSLNVAIKTMKKKIKDHCRP